MTLPSVSNRSRCDDPVEALTMPVWLTAVMATPFDSRFRTMSFTAVTLSRNHRGLPLVLAFVSVQEGVAVGVHASAEVEVVGGVDRQVHAREHPELEDRNRARLDGPHEVAFTAGRRLGRDVELIRRLQRDQALVRTGLDRQRRRNRGRGARGVAAGLDGV